MCETRRTKAIKEAEIAEKKVTAATKHFQRGHSAEALCEYPWQDDDPLSRQEDDFEVDVMDTSTKPFHHNLPPEPLDEVLDPDRD